MELTRRLVLGSASPRRRQILEQLGLDFRVLTSKAELKLPTSDGPSFALTNARLKAYDVANMARPDETIIAADTVVMVEEHILGKPSDAEDAERMLHMLNGKWHQVLTAVCVLGGDHAKEMIVRTEVKFRVLDPPEIRRYAVSGEGYDKAGSYAAQGMGAGLIEELRGSYTNVVGLPAAQTLEMLKSIGVVIRWP